MTSFSSSHNVHFEGIKELVDDGSVKSCQLHCVFLDGWEDSGAGMSSIFALDPIPVQVKQITYLLLDYPLELSYCICEMDLVNFMRLDGRYCESTYLCVSVELFRNCLSNSLTSWSRPARSEGPG